MSNDEAEVTLTMSEQAARLRTARSGKMSHVTRRMNIVNDLMIGEESLDEVKGNMVKFYKILEEFNTLNSIYVHQCLNEESRKDDDEKWCKPRSAQISAFVANVKKWISQMENPHDPNLNEVTSSAEQMGEPERPAESVDCGNDEHDADTNTDVNVDNTDALSVVSSRSSRASSSLRINAEAERLALIAKAAKLKEKHAIEA